MGVCRCSAEPSPFRLPEQGRRCRLGDGAVAPRGGFPAPEAAFMAVLFRLAVPVGLGKNVTSFTTRREKGAIFQVPIPYGEARYVCLWA